MRGGEPLLRQQPLGSAEIVDSFIHGTGGLDMIASYAGKSLKLSYSKLSGAHCGPHMQGIETFEIDHIVSEASFRDHVGNVDAKDPHDGKMACYEIRSSHDASST